MKTFTVASVIFILAIFSQDISTLPSGDGSTVEKNQRLHDGYRFEYEAEDGSSRQEIGTFVYKEDESEPILHVKGMYSYFGRNGRKFVIYYEADDKGVKTVGDFIPLAPSPKREIFAVIEDVISND